MTTTSQATTQTRALTTRVTTVTRMPTPATTMVARAQAARSGVHRPTRPFPDRPWFALLTLALAASACTGTGRSGARAPGQAGAVGGEQPGGTAGGPGAGREGGQADDEPWVRPPGLDLSASEKQKRVAEHLKRGQTAIEKSNDAELAINEAKQALAVDETSVDAMVLLAHGYYVKGYYDLVQDVLDKALQRGGEHDKKLHFLYGLIHDRNHRADQALEEYQKAAVIDPDYTSALMNLGVHLLRNKRYQEAVTLYERLTGPLGYRTAASQTNLGSAYRGLSAESSSSGVDRRNQLLLKAEQSYRQALTANRNYANAYYNLGLLYLDADPFPEGQADMEIMKRLTRAKSQFDEYRRLPGADQRLADEQVSVVQKLIDKEQCARQKAAERQAKQKAREAKEAGEKAKGKDDRSRGESP